MKNFSYAMDPILKQHEWEIDALKAELMTLNLALRERESEMQKLTGIVHSAEQEILSICRENVIIERDRKIILEIYLRDQRVRVEEKKLELDQARELAERVFSQLRKKKQSQRGIEKHRERKKKDFDAEAIRREALEADDLWLAKLAGSK
jgi:flagellar biosynthesis chaperone FliJ